MDIMYKRVIMKQEGLNLFAFLQFDIHMYARGGCERGCCMNHMMHYMVHLIPNVCMYNMKV